MPTKKSRAARTPARERLSDEIQERLQAVKTALDQAFFSVFLAIGCVLEGCLAVE
jgi:hypothetical protein